MRWAFTEWAFTEWAFPRGCSRRYISYIRCTRYIRYIRYMRLPTWLPVWWELDSLLP